MKKLILVLLVSTALCVSTSAQSNEKKQTKASEPAKTETTILKDGDKCPDFKFIDVNGKTASISDYKGKYILIDIWASWCPPCKKEIPHLHKLESRLEGKKIVILSISTDKKIEAWKTFLKNNNIEGNQFSFNGDWSFSKAFDAKTIPHFVLLDKKGKVVKQKMELRPSSGDKIYEYLTSLKGI